MRKVVLLCMSVLLLCALFGCTEKKQEDPVANDQEKTEVSVPETEKTDHKILVIYCSFVGEQYQVGVIDKGNTEILAKTIAQEIEADLFEVKPSDDHYPLTYQALTDVAKQEQNDNARPEYLREGMPDLKEYDTIFIGAPVWWGDWPMMMYTFFEENLTQLNGKTLIPFSTHGGSGLSGFDRKLGNVVKEAEILEGLAIAGVDCQNDPESVKDKVVSWLERIGY